MPIEKAQCTNCSGILEVDNSQGMAVCPYCGTLYVVSKAIKNYYNQIHNTNYIQNATFRMDSEFERLKGAGLGYLRLRDLESAQTTYDEMTRKYPQFFESWEGIVNTDLLRITELPVYQLVPATYTSKALTNAMKLATPQQISSLNGFVDQYKGCAEQHNTRVNNGEKSAKESFPDKKSIELFLMDNNCYLYDSNRKIKVHLAICDDGYYFLKMSIDGTDYGKCREYDVERGLHFYEENEYVSNYDSYIKFLDSYKDGIIPFKYDNNSHSIHGYGFFKPIEITENMRETIEDRIEKERIRVSKEKRKVALSTYIPLLIFSFVLLIVILHLSH